MTQLDGKSMDIVSDNIEKLRELFPEVFSEGKIDFKKLEEELGHIIDPDTERYNFTWAGKTEAKRIAQTPSTGTLRPSKEDSKNWDTTQNLYIEGDNLEVLKLLQKSYHKKVKMIYIDPPYNTGKDFVYKDNFHDNIQNYLEITSQVDSEGKKLSANAETNGRYHSDWLNMMYPRLKLARNLLRDDGVIFISIDDNEVVNLRKLCDEIFGEDNFRGDIIRATGTTTGQDARKVGSSFDYTLCYSKSDAYKMGGLPLVGKDLNRFNNDDNDGKGKYALLQLRKTGNADRKEDRENMFFPILAPDGSEVYPIGPTDYLSRWRVAKKSYEAFLTEGLIVWKNNENLDEQEADEEDDEQDDDDVNEDLNTSNETEEIDISKYKSTWKPYVKYYLSGRTKQVSNLWTDVDGNKKGSIVVRDLLGKKVFDNPKPLGFISRMISVSCAENDIILDFFSGSASTAHAIMQLNIDEIKNRQFIMVQLPEETDKKSIAYKSGYSKLSEIGKERIRRAGDKIIANNPNKDLSGLDIGFKVLKLDSSNIKAWDGDFENLQDNLIDAIDNIKEGRSAEDLLYEVLLKYGLDLTLPIEEKAINGSKIYVIGFGALIVCFDDHITLDTVKYIAKLKEEYESEITRVVFKDSSFADAVVKTNALQTLKQFGIDEVVSI
ncbi:MAG: site-specific DNA-methyltransferase [Sulfuricurvum sp.]|nr:site-specific DNA-methyltransferase [Sulfuricurvum sp.]